MNLFEFFDLVRRKHEPENAGIFDDDVEDEGDGILSEETYDSLGEDDWEKYGDEYLRG
jgi:hypothetical protein